MNTSEEKPTPPCVLACSLCRQKGVHLEAVLWMGFSTCKKRLCHTCLETVLAMRRVEWPMPDKMLHHACVLCDAPLGPLRLVPICLYVRMKMHPDVYAMGRFIMAHPSAFRVEPQTNLNGDPVNALWTASFKLSGHHFGSENTHSEDEDVHTDKTDFCTKRIEFDYPPPLPKE